MRNTRALSERRWGLDGLSRSRSRAFLGAAREERGRRRAAGGIEDVADEGPEGVDVDVRFEGEKGSCSSDGEEALIDGVTDEEALQRGLSRVGKYRVATPRDIRESLAKFSDTARSTWYIQQSGVGVRDHEQGAQLVPSTLRAVCEVRCSCLSRWASVFSFPRRG